MIILAHHSSLTSSWPRVSVEFWPTQLTHTTFWPQTDSRSLIKRFDRFSLTKVRKYPQFYNKIQLPHQKQNWSNSWIVTAPANWSSKEKLNEIGDWCAQSLQCLAFMQLHTFSFLQPFPRWTWRILDHSIVFPRQGRQQIRLEKHLQNLGNYELLWKLG